MRLVVGRISAGGGKIDGYATIVGHRQDIKQLLQVVSVVFIVAPLDFKRGEPTPKSFLIGSGVCSLEGHRGRVVVQFIQSQIELPDDMPDHVKKSRCIRSRIRLIKGKAPTVQVRSVISSDRARYPSLRGRWSGNLDVDAL
jgi:hypothetical protein